nr:ATP-binding protein [uncultured Prevotella sp.]
MRSYYHENEEVDFKIKLTLTDKYQLEDQYGLTAMMDRETNINAALTPRVRCRIVKFRQNYMEVKLVEVLGAEKSEFSLSEKELQEIFEVIHQKILQEDTQKKEQTDESDTNSENDKKQEGTDIASWNTENFRKLMLGDTPSDMFDVECHRWISNISQNISQNQLQALLQNIRYHCLCTLQSNLLLPRCKEAERILLEQRFTDVIELLSYYIQAIQILKEGKAEDTIEHILSTLADCAYIYQPRKQFCIMQCIFMLDVSIMEKQIGKILSTLRKQEVYLWTRTPFQMQWLKLLQSYVDFTYAQTDKLTSDSATKETMIQVLVTELMLSNHSTHKIYDSQLIQALLYRSLFSNKRKSGSDKRRKLDIDDETSIIITKQLAGQLMFECQVIEEGYECTGTLNVLEDVVPYYPGEVSIKSFQYLDKPLVLRAYLKDMNPDGTYVLALSEMIEDYEEEVRVNDIFYNSRLTCLLNNRGADIGRVPAISSEGLSVSVAPAQDMTVEELRKGMIVEVENISKGTNGYLNATYVREAPESRFNTAEAFHQLMLGYSKKEVYNPLAEKDEWAASHPLEPVYVCELMCIIEAKATLEEDNLKAYNYLNFCRLLAIILENKERISYYDSRLALLEILNDFSVLDKVDTSKIQHIADTDPELFDRNAILRHDFMQLRIIGCLDCEDHYEELYRWSCCNEDPQLQQLASLVLSHNFVKKSGLLSQAVDILDKIRALLKLQKSSSNKKNYGKEDFHTEFKTSIIYPENSMRVDVQAQTKKIMQELCAFLNADGGHLYLGVSDIGYEMGLEEDLKNQLFKGSRDKYEVYVNNQIVYYLGQTGAHYIHTHFDEDVKNAVLIIDVAPCPTPIAVGNEFFERMGTSARKVNDNYRDKFLAIRQQRAQELAPHIEDTKTDSVMPETVSEKEIVKPVESAPVTDFIQTSRIRNNALHEYEEGWRPSTAVICLMGTDEYKVLDEDDWQDYRLKLAVHEDEEEGWLILVYESGKVCKVSVEELLQRERGRVFKRNADEKLIFASIASNADSVCVGFIDGKNNRYVRFDDVERFGQSGMQGDGTLPMDVPNSGVHYVEVIAINKVPILRNIGRKTIGCILKTVEGKRCLAVLPDCKTK